MPHISVYTVAMRENIHEIPLLVDLIAGLGIKQMYLHGFLEDDNTKGEPLKPDDIVLLERYKKDAAAKGINITAGELPDGTSNTLRERTCIDPWKMVYVNAAGWINPCCYSFHDKSVYFGNIFETDLKKIWNNENYRDFRHKLKTDMPAPCLRCPRYGKKRAI